MCYFGENPTFTIVNAALILKDEFDHVLQTDTLSWILLIYFL